MTLQQVTLLKQTLNQVVETLKRLTGDHRDLHSSVSKVGKAIDRVSIFFVVELSDELADFYVLEPVMY